MNSIFLDKAKTPTTKDLKKGLGSSYDTWKALADFTNKSYPGAKEAWNFYNDKVGWSFRISDKRRVLIYLMPHDKFFQASMVFGQKATNEIFKSDIAESIQTEIKNAKVYPEGRVIRLEIMDKTLLNDIKKLIKIKISI